VDRSKSWGLSEIFPLKIIHFNSRGTGIYTAE